MFSNPLKNRLNPQTKPTLFNIPNPPARIRVKRRAIENKATSHNKGNVKYIVYRHFHIFVWGGLGKLCTGRGCSQITTVFEIYSVIFSIRSTGDTYYLPFWLGRFASTQRCLVSLDQIVHPCTLNPQKIYPCSSLIFNAIFSHICWGLLWDLKSP